MKVESVNRIGECGPMVNAPSAVVVADALHVFFFGGEYECSSGGALWHGVRRWRDGDQRMDSVLDEAGWKLSELVREEGAFQGNSVPIIDGGNVWLFFVTGVGTDWEGSRVRSIVSRDLGATWTEESVLNLPRGWLVGTAAVATSWGEIMLPIYDEKRGIGQIVIFDKDQVSAGAKELSSFIVAEEWVIQPALFESEGRLSVFLRSGSGELLRSHSDDQGRTWARAVSTGIPNPNARIALGRRKSGGLLMAYNPLQHGVLRFGPGQMCSGREIMRIARSDDGGMTWPRARRRDLLWGTGEYAYPWFVEGAGHSVGLVVQECRLVVQILWLGRDDGVVSWDGGCQDRGEEIEWIGLRCRESGPVQAVAATTAGL